MARRSYQVFILHFRRQNPNANPNPQIQIRNLTIPLESTTTASSSSQTPSTQFTNSSNYTQNQLQEDQSHFPHGKNQGLNEAVEEICGITRNQPRWESTLLSHFPSFNFSDPNLFPRVLKRHDNVFLSYRFYQWLVGSVPGSLNSLDSVSCQLLFDALVESKAGFVAKSLIGRGDFKPEQESFERLIRCFCENGSMEEAVDLFSKLKSDDGYKSLSLETWNSGMSGSIRVGRSDLVWRLYGEMMESGVDPDGETVGYLIEALCLDGKVGAGYEVLRQILDDGVTLSKVVFDKLISYFGKDKNHGRVSELLHVMIGKNQKPDVFTYQKVIKGLCKRRKSVEGYRIFNDLKSRGYVPHRVMYSTMIHGLCAMRWLGEARKLWFEMMQKGLIPNEYTYNALIRGYCCVGYLDEAWKLHKEMCDRGLKESTVSFNTLINGLCMNGKSKEAFVLYEQMMEKGILQDVITYNSLIHGFCKGGDVTKSEELFKELLAQGLQPDAFSYAPLIEQFCRLGSTQKALELWEDMEKRGLEPMAYNHECIIAGFCEQGVSAEAMLWLSKMLNKKLVPQKGTCERLVKCLHENDKLDDALVVLGFMFRLGYILSERLCHSIVGILCGDDFSVVDTSLSSVLEIS